MNIRNGRELPGAWTEGTGRRFLSLIYQPEPDGIPNITFGFVHLPPLTEGTRHQHEDTHEFWVIVAGSGEATIGHEHGTLKPGDVVHGPPGVPHQLINTSGEEPLEAVYVLSPAGDERNVLELMSKQGAQYLERPAETD